MGIPNASNIFEMYYPRRHMWQSFSHSSHENEAVSVESLGNVGSGVFTYILSYSLHRCACLASVPYVYQFWLIIKRLIIVTHVCRYGVGGILFQSGLRVSGD